MLFIPDKIYTLILLREAWKNTEAMLFGAAAHIIGMPRIERTVAFAGDDIGVEHLKNVCNKGGFGKQSTQLGPRLRGDDWIKNKDSLFLYLGIMKFF